MARPSHKDSDDIRIGAAADVVSGLTGAHVVSSEEIRRGYMNFKCRVRTEAGDDVMVRFYPRARSALVNFEPDLVARCHRAGIPVAQCIGDSRTGPPAPFAYMAYRRIEGETLTDRMSSLGSSQAHSLAKELVHCLHGLGAVEFDGVGDLMSGTTANAASWETFVEDAMSLGLDSVHRHRLLAPQILSDLEQVVRRGPPPERQQSAARMVWGDINFENILVASDGTLAGLIDFEGSLSGDPMATLGYALAAQGPSSFLGNVIATWPGFDAACDHAVVAWYGLLRAMRLAPYAHLPLPTGLPRDPLVKIFPGLTSAIETLRATAI